MCDRRTSQNQSNSVELSRDLIDVKIEKELDYNDDASHSLCQLQSLLSSDVSSFRPDTFNCVGEDFRTESSDIEIYPGISIKRVAWNKIKDVNQFQTSVPKAIKIPAPEDYDKAYVYVLCERMWGTEILSTHSIGGSVCAANKIKCVDNIPKTALPADEIEAIRGALKKKVILETGLDIPQRTNITVVKKYIRNKINNVVKQMGRKTKQCAVNDFI